MRGRYMSIRVTQQTMYNKMVGGMQSNLGAYMESIEQGSSQKKSQPAVGRSGRHLPHPDHAGGRQ